MTWAGRRLDTGRYYLDDASAGNLLTNSKGRVTLEHVPPLRYGEDFTLSGLCARGVTLTVLHPGGFGDLLWLNAIYEQMSAFGVLVRHSCFPHYAPVLAGFCEVLPYPLPVDKMDTLSPICMENLVMIGETGTEHPADRFAAAFGLGPVAKKAAYLVTDAERDAARSWWPRTPGKRRVAVQAQSSVRLKSWPGLVELPSALWREGWEVLIIGEPSGNTVELPPEVRDCTATGTGIRASLAAAAECDVCVGADSVLIHAAHALDIPAVGLFGPFAGAAYMAGYKGGWIQGTRECSPCSLDFEVKAAPAHCGPSCAALAGISVGRVVERARKILETL